MGVLKIAMVMSSIRFLLVTADAKGHGGNLPDSTLCGNGELGDNNQVQVALVLYLLDRENNRRE